MEALRSIEKYIEELEAIREYKKVKEEKELLSKKLEEKEKEIEELKARINELENLKILAEGKTLKEAEEAFLKLMEEEIKKRAEESFNKIKEEWEKKDKQKEVLKGAIEVVKDILEHLRSKKPLKKEIVDAGLDKEIRGMINQEVQARIDDEFLRRVREESEKIAHEKLEILMREELPKWYKEVMEPKLIELEQKIRDRFEDLLRTQFTVVCECGTTQTFQLMPENIEELMTKRSTVIRCINQNCMREIRIPLRSLIEAILFA